MVWLLHLYPICYTLHFMNVSFKRYDDTMLQALADQPIPALALHALIRGIAFTLAIQLISLLSGLIVSNIVQILILILVFSVLVFSFDILEKYWAQSRLKKLL
jgi:uncharacterized membrane protein